MIPLIILLMILTIIVAGEEVLELPVAEGVDLVAVAEEVEADLSVSTVRGQATL